MRPLEFEELAKLDVPKLLERYLETPARLQLTKRPQAAYDFTVKTRKHRFEIEATSMGNPGPVQLAITRIEQDRDPLKQGLDRIPVVVVPYMGPSAARLCEQSGISWLDLSGNASIKGVDLRIYVQGHPNRFGHSGPAASVFSVKSSRVVRQLLMEPHRIYQQKELVKLTGLPQGNVSQIIKKLIESSYLIPNGRNLKVNRPDLLLAEWREKYDFHKHQLFAGHVPTRSGESLLRTISQTLSSEDADHAATGLAGAWLLTHFAGFRLATIFMRRRPNDKLLGKLGFRRDSHSPNVWLVVPSDEAVFSGELRRDGIPCVHPIQVYLDLKAQPERAPDAEPALKELFAWERSQS